MTDTELERRVDCHLELVKVQEWCAKHREEVMAMPLPRNECPGCFCAIHDDAAKDGWCWDCNPTRRKADRVDVTNPAAALGST